MIDKGKFKIGLFVFGGLIIVVIISIYLIENNYIPKNIASIIMVSSMIIAFLLGNVLTLRYERSKIFKGLINNILFEQGLILIDERPLTFQEIFKYLDLIPKPTIFINDIPISRFGYKTKNYRMIKVKNGLNRLSWICCEITITLKKDIKLRVIKQIEIV